MSAVNEALTTTAWWQSAAFRANRWYALGIVLATLVAVGIPFLLGQFVPCAQFMEVEWFLVAVLCVSGVGLLNIAFSFLPLLEAVLPSRALSALRVFVLIVAPMLILLGAMWLAFSPFWYALFNDPELLCD